MTDYSHHTPFDQVAEAYDRYRPGYPEEMFDDLLRIAGTPPRGRVLEVGAGTGQATRPLAKRGLTVVALEPGATLAALARQRLEGLPAMIIESRFEDFDPGRDRFELLVSGTAFHWVDEDLRYPKAHDVLRRGGAIALFWNEQVWGPESAPMFRALQPAYERFGPDPIEDWEAPRAQDLRDRTDEIEAGGWFEDTVRRHYPWTATYTADEYVNLVATYSPNIRQDADARTAFLDAIRRTIDEELGGSIVKDHVTDLYVSRRAER